jgi:hypothetical protein
MASLTDYVDTFLNSDLLFCTITCSAIFLSVFLIPWFFCSDLDDGDFDQLEDEDYVSNAPLYFNLLFLCLSCFAILLDQLQFDVAVLEWAGEIPSDHWFVVGITLLVGALGLFLVVAEFQRGGDATLPLAGEQGRDASPLETTLEDSIFHCIVTFFTVAIQIPTLPFRLVKAICKPLATYIYGPICAPGERLVPNEVYDAMVQELRNKDFKLSIMRTRNEELKFQAEKDRLKHESELRIARMGYQDLEAKAEADDLRHQLAMREEMQLSSTLTQIGMDRDAQNMMALIHRLALLNAAPESDNDDIASESAAVGGDPVTEPRAEVEDVEQNHDIKAAENDIALDGELATELATEDLAGAVATKELEAEEFDNNETDEGDDVTIDDSVNIDQPTTPAEGEKKKKKKKVKSNGKAKKRRAGKDLLFRKELAALGQEKDALETSWAESRQQRAATTQAVDVNTSQAAVTTTAPVQQSRPAVNTAVQVQQQPQAPLNAAANTFKLAPRVTQPTREQIWQFNGWKSEEDVRIFQRPQQHTYGQNAGQHDHPRQLFQPSQQQTYGQAESQQQQPRPQYWHEFSGTERQPGQYNLFGPPFFQ